MRQALFFDGQNVLDADLNEIETSKSNELRRRLTDMSLQMGIMYGLTVTNPLGFTLRVAPGVAYDEDGEACIVGTNQDVVVSALDVGKILVIRHVSNTGTNVEHPVTGVLNATRRTDSFALAMVTTPASDEIPLAQLDALSGGGTATLDATVRVFWSPRIAPGVITDDMLDPNGDVITHINARGTGVFHPQTNPHAQSPADIGFTPDITPTQHQLLDHENGFETIVASAGHISVDASTAPDRLLIEQLQTGDNLVINGIRLIGGTANFNPIIITFGVAPANPALFEIYSDAAGVVSSRVIAQYGSPANITGLQVIDVDPTHPAGTFTFSWDHITQELTWNNSGPFLIDPPSGTFNGDKNYTIFSGTKWIKVHIDFSALPSSVQTDNVTISTPLGVPPLRMTLGLVYWSGSGTGFLGYGDWNASGVALDKRPLGTLAFKHLADSMKQELYQRLNDASGNGWVQGGSGASPGGLQWRVQPAVLYIAGRRFTTTETTLTLPDNQTSFVWVNESGVVTQSLFDPAVVNARQPIPFLHAYRVTTSSGVVSASLDTRQYFVFNGKNNVWVGTQSFRGTKIANTERTLATEYLSNLAASRARHYINDADANLEMTVNARWDEVADQWNPDSSDLNVECAKIVYDDDQVTFNWFNHTNAPFADASFKQSVAIQSMEGFAATGMLLLGAGYRGSLADALKSRTFVEAAPLATSNYTLINSYKSGDNASIVREYLVSFSADAEFVRTYNCRRVADSDPMWAADVAGEAMLRDHRSAYARNVFSRGAPGSLAPVNNTTFVQVFSEMPSGTDFYDLRLRNGRVEFDNTGSHTNPAPTAAVTNTLLARNLIKAWGNVTTGGGSPVLNDGFNVTSVAYNGTSGLTVNLASPLDATSFPCVIGGFSTGGSVGGPYFVSPGAIDVSFAGSQVFLHVRNTSTSPAAEEDLAGLSGTLCFLVLGVRTL